MGVEQSQALEALSQVDKQVDILADELHSILDEHRQHSGRAKATEVRTCHLCADVLAALSMRVYDLQLHIDKLAAGDATSKYHRAHAHRPIHERQQLSHHAKRVLQEIQQILDHDIYHLESRRNPRDESLSLPVISRRHARIESPGDDSATPTPRAPKQTGDAFFDDIVAQQELERMAVGEDLPEEARPGEGLDDDAHDVEIDDIDPLPLSSRPESPSHEVDAVAELPTPVDPDELQSRLSALSTAAPMQRVTNRRAKAPARKHNVSLAINPMKGIRSKHARIPSRDSILTGDSDSTRATFGDAGQPDLASVPDQPDERNESYSPRRQESMDVPATTQEESARLVAIRDIRKVDNPKHPSISEAAENQPTFEVVFSNEPKRQETDSSRFETLEESIQSCKSGRL